MRNKAEQFSAATKGVSNAAQEAGKSAERSAPKMNSFVQSIARIAKYRMIRAVIRSITDAVKEGAESFYGFTQRSGGEFANYAKALDGVKAASSQMKNQVGAAFGTLYTNIAPIINNIISLATRLANVLTMLFARLGGADGWYRAAEGANATADAIGGVGAAAKKALRYLAPFDELNRLPSNDESGGGGGGGSSGSSGGNYEWVSFEQFDIGDGVASVFKWLEDAFNNASDWIQNIDWQNLAGNIATEIGNAFGKIDWAGLAQAVSGFIGSAFGAAVGLLYGVVLEFVTAVGNTIFELFVNDDGTVKSGAEIVNGIWTGIKNAFVNAATWITDNIVKPFVNAFKKAFGIESPAKEMLEPGKMVGEGVLEGISGVFTDIKNWVKENIFDKILAAWDTLKTGFSLAVDVGVGLLKNGWSTVASWIWGGGSASGNWGGALSKSIALAKNAWTTVGSWIWDGGSTSGRWGGALSKAVGLGKTGWTTVASWIWGSGSTSGNWGGALNKAVGLAKSGWETVGSWVSGNKDRWGGSPSKAIGLVTTGWTTVADWVKDNLLGGTVTQALSISVTATISKTVTTFINAWNKLSDKALELKATISDNVKKAWNTAANAWNGNTVLKKLATLPTLARGGIVDQATWIGNAIVGEAGREAIVPLERNTEWIGMVASGLMGELAQNRGSFDYAAMGEAMYAAMTRALAENQDDNVIELDGEVVYRKMVQRNRQQTFLIGANPMMA